MKVFMSWSGDRSKAAAELLHDWIKCVIQASRPWISTRGIGRGAVWFSEINNELKDTSVGIICLTHENKNAPWILFEAGALAKGLTTTKVCTFLVDLGTSDIRDPLAQFNHTLPTKDGMMSLAATLNSALESPLDSNTLSTVFEAFWPQFEANFKAMLEQIPQEAKIETKSDTSILEAILESTRGLSQRMRSIEDRQIQRPIAEPPTAWPFPTEGESLAATLGTSIPKQMNILDGVALVQKMLSQGMSASQISKELSRKTGPRRAQLIMHEAKKILPPDALDGLSSS